MCVLLNTGVVRPSCIPLGNVPDRLVTLLHPCAQDEKLFLLQQIEAL
jgi:hypothetical protein